MMRQEAIGFGLMLLLVLVVGCSRLPPTAKVTGTVTYSGKPVEGASVGFIPESGRPAAGTTDASGRFTLSTFASGDGAVLGLHTVTISEVYPDAPMPGTLAAENWQQPEPRFPTKYSDPSTSGFTATVAKGEENDFTFNMTD